MDTNSATHGERPLIVVPDTNVILHGKPLAELPWEQFGAARVDVVLVDSVLAELDGWKSKGNDVRAKRVRAMLPFFRQLLESSDLTINLSNAKCDVRLRMPRSEFGGALGASDADGAIITAVSAMAAQGGNAVLLTRDVVMALRAQRRGVSYRLLHTDDAIWNAKPDAKDTDLAETKRKLREFERQSPEFKLAARGRGFDIGDRALTALVPKPFSDIGWGSFVTAWAEKEFVSRPWKGRDLNDTFWRGQLKEVERILLIQVLKRLRFGPVLLPVS